MKSFIKCVNVECEESKIEEFNGEKNSTWTRAKWCSE